MASTFTFVPDRGFNKSSKARVLLYQFGDGYSQRVSDGINNINTTWQVSFNSRDLEESAAIIAFFEVTKGTNYFLWTPPDEATQVKVIVSDWTSNYESAISRNTSATFTRVYDL